mmetsp:Transcript_66771/g.121876  ORF Transcript_66771/g.121876 Transcript_66771/m.121876 type:complete len:167 (-) Transcript_66771:2-502(-)
MMGEYPTRTIGGCGCGCGCSGQEGGQKHDTRGSRHPHQPHTCLVQASWCTDLRRHGQLVASGLLVPAAITALCALQNEDGLGGSRLDTPPPNGRLLLKPEKLRGGLHTARGYSARGHQHLPTRRLGHTRTPNTAHAHQAALAVLCKCAAFEGMGVRKHCEPDCPET